MHALLAVSHRLERIVSAIGQAAAWLSVPLILVVIYDVITRNVLTWLVRNQIIGDSMADALTLVSSTKLQETEWHLHGVLLLMTFGMAYLKDAHVRIELVRDSLRPRVKVWIEFIGILLALVPYCALVIYFGYDFTVRSYETHEVSAALTGLPYRFIIKSFIMFGFLVILMAGVAIWLRCVVALFGGGPARAEAMALLDPEHDAPQGAKTR